MKNSQFFCPPFYTRPKRINLEILVRLHENALCFRQKIKRPQLSLLGAFRGKNTGDNTLGLSVLNLARQQSITGGLQNIYNLNQWTECELTVCASGATGVEQNMINLIQRNKSKADKTALVRMDFSSDIEKFSDEVLSFLSNVKYISCRNKRQSHNLASVLGSDNVHYQPDNEFAYPFSYLEKTFDTSLANNKVLGFNSLNLFMTWIRGKGFTSGTPLEEWYRKMGSQIANYIKIIGLKYIEYLNNVLDIYSDRGWKIIHIPFAIEDDLFAQPFFNRKKVIFLNFIPNPDQLFSYIRQCDMFISTRFHSLVFSLIAGVPCIPINYAGKCQDLIFDLELDINNAIDRMELITSFSEAIDKAVNPKPLIMAPGILILLANEASISITNAIRSIV